MVYLCCIWSVLVYKDCIIPKNKVPYVVSRCQGVEHVDYIRTPTRRGWHIGPKKVFGMQLLTVRYDHILSADLSRGLRICSDAVERDLWTIELIEISLFTF